MLVPQLPAGAGQTPVDAEVPEDAMERLAHLEQLVVHLKELIRDKDTQLLQRETELTSKDAQFKHLRTKLGEEEANSQEMKERLLATEQLLQEKEAAHAEQVMILGL
ncbi:hypothetical protein GOODEAATRI_004708 [Goodea atripinnis]|uniref:A-kinase anchor protein 9 n=1 Tax=Goodea atripinnis TaxID=208336 RepID=A0ABV0MYR5_9TELE